MVGSAGRVADGGRRGDRGDSHITYSHVHITSVEQTEVSSAQISSKLILLVFFFLLLHINY